MWISFSLRMATCVCGEFSRPLAREWFAQGLQVVAHFNTLPVVHGQQLHGRTASRRSTDDQRALPCEVFRPLVSPWMEQRHKLSAFRIKASNVRSLLEVAKAARQSQIVRFSGTAMLASDDVLDMEACEPGSCLR